MWWYHNGNAHWGWMVFGMMWMVIFWAAIIWFFVWALRKTGNGSDAPRTPGASALDIARARYARGEITREQFEEIKRTLSA